MQTDDTPHILKAIEAFRPYIGWYAYIPRVGWRQILDITMSVEYNDIWWGKVVVINTEPYERDGQSYKNLSIGTHPFSSITPAACEDGLTRFRCILHSEPNDPVWTLPCAREIPATPPQEELESGSRRQLTLPLAEV